MYFFLILLLHCSLQDYTVSSNIVRSNIVREAALDELNGQTNPAEAQCIALFGECFRHDTTDDISDCETIQCRRLPLVPRSPPKGTYRRLDGTYCGPGKTCQSGKCLDSTLPLGPVQGAWSEWIAADSQTGDCSVDGCADACQVVGQRRVRIERRQCNRPFANNGGKQCSSRSNVRGVACDSTPCTESKDGSNITSADLMKCSRDNNHSKVDDAIRDDNNDCLLICKIGNTEMKTNVVNGLQCMDGNGICVEGKCADVNCNDGTTFVSDADDCPDYDPLAGQRLPLDAQCQNTFGECATFYPSTPVDSCGASMCKIGPGLEELPKRRRDGTYCGANHTCLDGRCTETNTSLTVHNGGWSAWSESAPVSCGGLENSCELPCEYRQIRQVVVQHRVCNNSYPNNGGAQCSGGNVRAKSCQTSPCQTGLDLRETLSNCTPSGKDCLPECQNIYTPKPNGAPCDDGGGGSGICINGECASIVCNDNLTYAFNDEDCPTEISVDKSFFTKNLFLILAIIFTPTILTALLLCFITIERRRKRPRLLSSLSIDQSGQNKGSKAAARRDPFEISGSKLQLYGSQIIGKGAFSVVYKGRLRGNAPAAELRQTLNSWMFRDCDVAIKTLLITSPMEASALSREIEIMKKLDFHPHIIAFLGCVTITDPVSIVMELGEESLLNYIKNLRELVKLNDEKLSEKQLVSLCWQISDGLCYLKTKKLIHRDLAARNVILVSGLQAKISDFGLCLECPNDEPIIIQEPKSVPVRWLAIECLLRAEFSYASDVWSFGVLMFEIFSLGIVPYSDNTAISVSEYLEQGGRLPQPCYASDEIYEVMLSCWLTNTEERITCTALYELLSGRLNEHAPEYGYVDAINSQNQS